MPFDTQAGTSGAMAGLAAGGPYGAAAGFVLGGFLGGSYAAGQKKQRRTLEKKIRRRLDPNYYKGLVQQYTPIARESVLNAGAGNVIKQEIQGNISRRGLTGTGLGTAFQNAAALAPSALASQQAQGMATTNLNNELGSIMSIGSYNAPDISSLSRQSAGDIATAIAIFRSLKNKSQGNAAYDTSGPAWTQPGWGRGNSPAYPNFPSGQEPPLFPGNSYNPPPSRFFPNANGTLG